MAKTKKQTATDDAVQFDYTGFLTETVDAVAQRLNYDSDPIESATPMSTGMLTLDLLYGGGIRPGWYTHFGKEQSSKTTGALVIAANAIKEKVPLITFFDYEGCVTANTLIQVKGQNIKLKDLFDLSDYKNWTPNTWQDQTHVVDTLCNNERGYKSAKARLFYKGIHPTQKIIFNTGHELECYNHKFFVYRNGYLAVVSQQDLQVGELVFVRKDYFEPMQEEWRPVVGEGKGIRRKFEVSNCGRVRSTGDKRLVKRKDSDSVFVRTIAPRLLAPRTLKDGHQSVCLCMDHRITQRLVHRLVARAFIGKAPRGLPLVCHYNDDPADNRVFNLHYSDDVGNNREKALHWRAPHSQNAILANSTSAFRDRIRDLYEVFTMKEIREMYPEASYHTVSKYWKTELCKDEFFEFSFDSIRSNYELASIVSIEDTEKEKPVFDIGLHNETDFLPHSIITNGIVTHNSSVNSMPYIQSILKTVGIDKTIAQVFGAKDHDSGKWITPPIIRFHVESVAEKFFDFLANVLRELPDKKMINGRWWLIYEDNKKNKARVGEFADPSMGKRYGPGLWVPAPDGELQALFIVDSYPAMNPASNDEEETDNSLALQARMFSKQLPRVKGRLMQKMVAVIGTNQLRDAPMVMYGPKENEPGGQALKFNCFGQDTLLLTKYGLLSAKEFHALSEHTHLQSISGMESIAGWKCVGYSNTIKAKTSFGYSVTGKPGHKVLIISTSEKKLPTMKWVTLEDLTKQGKSPTSKGSYLGISVQDAEKPTEYQHVVYQYVGSTSQTSQLKNRSLDLICDETLGELLGWIVSEGFVGPYTVSISNSNDKHLARIAKVTKRLGFNPIIKDKCVEIYDATLAQWLQSIGCKCLAMHKSIPLIIRMSPASVQIAFTRGLLAGDGNAQPRETSYYSISNTLLDQLQAMLLSFGIICKKSPYHASNREHKLCLTSEQLQISISKLTDTKINHLDRFHCGSLYFSGYNNTLLRELIRWRTRTLVNNSDNEVSDVLPELFTNYIRGRKPKVYKWFKEHIQGRNKYWRTRDFYEGWFDDYKQYAVGLRTSQERKVFIDLGVRVKELVEFTRDNNIVWQQIVSLDADLYQPCYDACVPGTHTIWTNGVVSHNSDVRCKFTPRSSGQPLWPKNFDKETGWEIEPSVEFEKGRDSYRYIHLKTIKNKLSVPNRVGWIRIWTNDGEGSARGYDPVFDTIYYLYVTGQLVGRGRKSMKLKLSKTDIEPSVTWIDLKRWILGDRATKVEMCEKFGYKQKFCLRKFCFNQLKKGIGEKLYIEHTQSSSAEDDSEE